MQHDHDAIRESNLHESRKHVLALVGDVTGFGRWARKCAEDPAGYRRFMAHLYDAFLAYRNQTGGFIKLVGDGLLAVHELESGHEPAIAERVFLNAFHLKKIIRHSIMGQMFPRPDGFRVRLVGGYVWKIILRMGEETLVDYNGYWINAGFRYLSVHKDRPFVAHTGAVELLPQDFDAREKFVRIRLPSDDRTPDGLDREDMAELWAFDRPGPPRV